MSNIVKVKLEGTNNITPDPQNKISKRKQKNTCGSLKKKSKKKAKSSIASEDSADDTISLNCNGFSICEGRNTSENLAISHSKLLGDCVGSYDSEKRLQEDDCDLFSDVAVQSRSDEIEAMQNCDDEQIILSICKAEERNTDCGDGHNTISEACKDEMLQKYWYQRYRLFSRFDKGIKIDKGAFNSILCCFKCHVFLLFE